MVWVLPSNAFKLFFPRRTEEHSVDPDENIDESLLEILLLKLRVFLELIDEVVAAVLGDLSSAVAIEYGEERKTRNKIGSRDMCVLIRLAPALHA